MTHDPLCVELYRQVIPTPAESCIACSVIAKVRADVLRDAAGEAALALLAMDGVEFTPEQHNSVIDAILSLQEKP